MRRDKDSDKIAELLSIAVKPGTILQVKTSRKIENRFANYAGPVERIDDDSVTLISGEYYFRNGVPVARWVSDKVCIFGREIRGYEVLSPLLAATVPRFKRNY